MEFDTGKNYARVPPDQISKARASIFGTGNADFVIVLRRFPKGCRDICCPVPCLVCDLLSLMEVGCIFTGSGRRAQWWGSHCSTC